MLDAKLSTAKENLNLKTRLISIEKALEHFEDQAIDVKSVSAKLNITLDANNLKQSIYSLAQLEYGAPNVKLSFETDPRLRGVIEEISQDSDGAKSNPVKVESFIESPDRLEIAMEPFNHIQSRVSE